MVRLWVALLLAACSPGRSAGSSPPAASPQAPPAAASASVLRLGALPCEDATCYELEVTCEGVPPRGVVVREYGRPESRGTVIFTTGGSGHARYDREGREVIQARVREAGFEVYQIEWLGEEGWVTGAYGYGFKDLLCGYAEVVRWIVAERASNPDLVCAQGNSGGSLQNAYALAVYGLEDVLDMVILSGGPPIANVQDFCFPENAEFLKQRMAARDPAMRRDRRTGAPARRPPPGRPFPPNGTGEEGELRLESVGRTLSDRVMGWMDAGDYCQRMERPPSPDALAAADRTSLLPHGEERDLDYPHTKLNFVGAEADGHYRREGYAFYEAVESGKSWYLLPDGAHNIDKLPGGAAKIVELFANECHPW